MSKLYDLQELVEKTGMSERTVRYYLAKVLEAPGGTRGRKTFYPPETLDQLKLAKQILMAPYDPKRGEVKPSLRDFRHWLHSQSTQEISIMAAVPYRIKPKMLLAASAPQMSPSSNKEPGLYSQGQDEQQHRQTPWQSFQFGDDIDIRIRKRLTSLQKQQLALAGQLLQSMLEKE